MLSDKLQRIRDRLIEQKRGEQANVAGSKGYWKPVEIDFMKNNVGNFQDFSGLVAIEEFKPVDLNAFIAENQSFGDEDVKKPKSKKKNKNKRKREDVVEINSDKSENVVDVAELDSKWLEMNLNPVLLRGIAEKGFLKPTPIQERCIPPANNFRQNVIAAAETGSGKTLAFAIPILDLILQERSENPSEKKGVRALIFTPTRELALQITDHIKSVCSLVKIATLVGGMSTQKQERLLNARPEIVIATPGRFWDWVQMNNTHLAELDSLRFLVIDEADRMILDGHFKDLTLILEYIERSTKNSTFQKQGQTFLFSATLNVDDKKGIDLSLLTKKLGLDLDGKNHSTGKKTAVVDLSTENKVARKLTEASVECPEGEKEMHLYYFLSLYPGKTIVFANSIGTTRKLMSIMSLLKLPVHLLHAKMQQRQRLKNLDHFKASKNGILICTDVAARGLDIPQVQQVVHYELPTSSEVYVHRSGRTARAGENGFCLSLVGTKELITYKNLCASLGYSDIPSFRVLMKIYKKIQPLVRSCIEVEKLMNQDRKASMNDNWFVKSAQDLDIELDEVVLDNIKKHKKDEDDLNAQNSHDNKLKKMKNKFSMLLSEFDSFKTRMAKEVPSLNV